MPFHHDLRRAIDARHPRWRQDYPMPRVLSLPEVADPILSFQVFDGGHLWKRQCAHPAVGFPLVNDTDALERLLNGHVLVKTILHVSKEAFHLSVEMFGEIPEHLRHLDEALRNGSADAFFQMELFWAAPRGQREVRARFPASSQTDAEP